MLKGILVAGGTEKNRRGWRKSASLFFSQVNPFQILSSLERGGMIRRVARRSSFFELPA
jgi:hypothetical protein